MWVRPPDNGILVNIENHAVNMVVGDLDPSVSPVVRIPNFALGWILTTSTSCDSHEGLVTWLTELWSGLQLQGLQQQLASAGISSSCPGPDQPCLSAAAAHSTAIDNVIKQLSKPTAYTAARDALLSKFWTSFTTSGQQLDMHTDKFYLQFDSWLCPLVDDWICQELLKTAHVLQHDLCRLGYNVQLHDQNGYSMGATLKAKDVLYISITYCSADQQQSQHLAA